MSEEQLPEPEETAQLEFEPSGGGDRGPLRLILAAVVVIAVVGGFALAWALTRSDDPEEIAEPSSTTSTVAAGESTTTIPASDGPGRPAGPVPPGRSLPAVGPGFPEGAGDDAASDFYAYGPPPDLPELSVGSVSFSWAEAALDVPDGVEVWVSSVVATGDGFLAVGSAYDPTTGAETSFVWRSSDGVAWQRLTPGFGDGASIHSVAAHEGRALAVGSSSDATALEPAYTSMAWLSTDNGSTWQPLDLGVSLAAGESLWVGAAAAGAEGFVVFGNAETYAETPFEPLVVVIEKDGKLLRLDEDTFTFTITDAATGAELLRGSQDEIFRYDEFEGPEGFSIYHPETGALIVTVPWDVWEEAFALGYGYGGVFPIEQSEAEVLIEHGGFRITISDSEDTFTVEEVATGTVVASGNQEAIHRGPAPTFVDPSSGEVVLTLTWEEFDEAQEAAFSEYEEGFSAGEDYSRRLIGRWSADGSTWSDVEFIGGATPDWIENVTATGTGFLAWGGSEDAEFNYTASLWTSADGRVWQQGESIAADVYFHGMTATDDGVVGFRATNEWGQGVWISADGSDWAEVLEPGKIDDLVFSPHALAAGRPGIAVVGFAEDPAVYASPEPLQITKNGYTLVIDDFEGRAAVLGPDGVAVFEVFDRYGLAGLPEGVTHENGVTAIRDESGTIVFEISDTEFSQAQDDFYTAQELQFRSPTTVLLFSDDEGATWNRVETAGTGLETIFANSITVGDDVVVVVGEARSLELDVDAPGGSPTIFVGRPA